MLAANVCCGRLHRARQASGAVPRARGPDAGEADAAAELPEGARPGPVDRRRPEAGRVSRRSPQATKDRPDAAQIHTMLLRSMQQAIYTGTTAATSAWPTRPTRTSRARSAAIPTCSCIASSRRCSAGKPLRARPRAEQPPTMVAPQGRARRGTRPARDAQSRCRRRARARGRSPARICSANERRADEASRDVEAWLKCRYMREHLGEELRRHGQRGRRASASSSRSTACTSKGLVHVTELGGEYFRFDEVRQELRGERTGLRYVVGTRVRVQVSRVDLDGRKIDFRMVRDGEEPPLAARTQRDKARGATTRRRARSSP